MNDNTEPRSGNQLGRQARTAGRTARNIGRVASANKALRTGKGAAKLLSSPVVTYKSVLIGIGILLLVELIFAIIGLVPFNISSSITHLNDPEQLSSEEDFLSYQNSDKAVSTLKKKALDTTKMFDKVRKAAYEDAKSELYDAAERMGIFLRSFPAFPAKTAESDLVMLFSSYSASMQNAVSASAFTYFQDDEITGAIDDMESKLLPLLRLPHTEMTYGNRIYGSDFLFLSDGTAIGLLSKLNVKEISASGFDINYSAIYDDPSISTSTYQDVITSMCSTLGEILYGISSTTGITQVNPSSQEPVWALELGSEYGGVIDIALDEFGQYGGEPYWSWYGFDSRVAWCAIFVSWCANQADVPAEDFPRFSSCRDGIAKFKSMGRYQTANTGYTPKTGDLIFFDWEPDGTVDHVGYVASCDGSMITTIEGNMGPLPGEVGSRSIAVSSIYIVGYAFPNYQTAD